MKCHLGVLYTLNLKLNLNLQGSGSVSKKKYDLLVLAVNQSMPADYSILPVLSKLTQPSPESQSDKKNQIACFMRNPAYYICHSDI
jgi:hypothetical protein